MSSIIKPYFGAQLNLDHPLAQGLVGCWLMNEGSGVYVNDSSGQGNTGTISGMNNPPISTSGWNAGPHGGALVFDGVNDCVNCGNPANLNFTNSFTIVIYASLNSRTILQDLVVKGGSFGTANNYGVSVYNNLLYFDVWVGGVRQSVPASLPASVTVGTLHQFVGIYDNPNRLMYVDGRPIATPYPVGYPLDTNSSNVKIGSSDSNRYFPGRISSVFIYNRAPSAEEIAYLYAFPYCMFERNMFLDLLKIIEPVMQTRRYIPTGDRTIERLLRDDRDLMELIAISVKSGIL